MTLQRHLQRFIAEELLTIAQGRQPPCPTPFRYSDSVKSGTLVRTRRCSCNSPIAAQAGSVLRAFDRPLWPPRLRVVRETSPTRREQRATTLPVGGALLSAPWP